MKKTYAVATTQEANIIVAIVIRLVQERFYVFLHQREYASQGEDNYHSSKWLEHEHQVHRPVSHWTPGEQHYTAPSSMAAKVRGRCQFIIKISKMRHYKETNEQNNIFIKYLVGTTKISNNWL